MSITMLQHFNYPETLSYEGNTELSNASKFGKACAHFRDSTSKITLTNTTGVFNLSTSGSVEAECFVNVGQYGGSNMDAVMIEELLANGYYMYDGHVFKRYDDSKTWTDAKAFCEILGGHLATSTSAEKNAFLVTIANGNNALLGGTDETEEGVWQWITGEEWSYTNWNSGEPNNINGGEHYLEIGTSGVWNDAPSTHTNRCICEWDCSIDNMDLEQLYMLEQYGCLEFNGHILKCISHDSYTWQQAKEKCEALGGCLASVTSAEKQILIQSLCNNNYAWLGGQEVNSQWTWLTDETWGYTNWNGGEPSESGDGVGLRKNPDGTWAARKTDINGRSICEWDSLEAAYYGVNDYKFYNGHTFKYYSDSVTWSAAKTACEALSGHLATSTSAEKNTFLTTITTNTVWLGGTDEETEGTWQWITGEEWSYTNWASNQPDNASSAEHYLQLNYANTGAWNDHTSTTTCGYICEWDYDFRESGNGGVSSGNILSISDTRGVISSSDAETQGYKFYNGHTYKVFTEQTNWENAKTECETLGGHLVTITNAEEEAFIESLIDGSNNYWIGGKKINDVWTWVTEEEWSYTHWANGQPNNNGNPSEYLLFWGGNGKQWDDETNSHNAYYICEWNYDIREPKALTLSIANGGVLSLVSPTWGLNETSTLTLDPDTWHHVLLRLSGRTASVYLDGVQALSGRVSGEDITPESIILGGYTGYMDEFVFRNEAGTGAPVVPIVPYEMSTGSTVSTTSNAPVTRVAWSCSNLPEGLTLSSSGVLSGHPTTAGKYNCDVSVATNWGTATKTITITVS